MGRKRRCPIDAKRKQTRKWLKESTLAEYEDITTKAKLTPRQKEILDRVILKEHSEVKISLDLFIDVSGIKKILKSTYSKISRVLC